MARYVLTALVEVDEKGVLQVPLTAVGAAEEDGEEAPKVEMAVPGSRDISKIEGRVPFLRFGLVDRDRRNRVVFSAYDLARVLEARRKFSRSDVRPDEAPADDPRELANDIAETLSA